MTPAARIASAIDILDDILSGTSAEKALKDWARGHRFAGSKDRAALRDHVFDALRQRRSLAALGGADTGRGLMIGWVRASGGDVDQIFSGEGYGPLALSDAERDAGRTPDSPAERLDLPDWLYPEVTGSLGDAAGPCLELLRQRAPVFLRVHLRKAPRSEAMTQLASEGITTEPHDLSPSALRVIEGARRIRTSAAYLDGLVELQDAASQAVSDRVPLEEGQSLLDYCAGGGGKTLAIAGRVQGRFVAHDANPARMKDLPARAARAGLSVRCLTSDELKLAGIFDTVVVDAPCSGSGSWRRDPEGKWGLTAQKLAETVALQARILDQAAAHVGVGGHLTYMTCSILQRENAAQVADFLARTPGWSQADSHQFLPQDGGDGFFFADLTRNA
ncbi:RsmB/NOP family class I SAM-dependent RNA methyltransferase [Meridianimarinicoccus sp. MJW13]|uniref:RsmB/NOP family class I SAM-dependent RNA methyltransferase n=1 Tax=Meridianimarinicoccus sp. MJW13 TaxID=2720031 RepID=UPI0018665B3E|nr:RsmB/NOP family class I SAM-dependent RNA methyltransferase [Fluviibacterium sp. MJW13]